MIWRNPRARRADYQSVFGGEAGRRVLTHLVRQFGHVRGATLVPGDPSATAFHEGQRTVVFAILRALGETPRTLPESLTRLDPETRWEDGE